MYDIICLTETSLTANAAKGSIFLEKLGMNQNDRQIVKCKTNMEVY